MTSRPTFIALALTAPPLLMTAFLGWGGLTYCRTIHAKPNFADHGPDPDWIGPPDSLRTMVARSDVIVYGVVHAVEPLDDMGSSKAVLTMVEVVQGHLGPSKAGDRIQIIEPVGPRAVEDGPTWSCNRGEDGLRLRRVSRPGDRRLWFLNGDPRPGPLYAGLGAYGRLDIESDSVRLTSPRPVSLAQAELEGPGERADFLAALQEAVAAKGR